MGKTGAAGSLVLEVYCFCFRHFLFVFSILVIVCFHQRSLVALGEQACLLATHSPECFLLQCEIGGKNLHEHLESFSQVRNKRQNFTLVMHIIYTWQTSMMNNVLALSGMQKYPAFIQSYCYPTAQSTVVAHALSLSLSLIPFFTKCMRVPLLWNLPSSLDQTIWSCLVFWLICFPPTSLQERELMCSVLQDIALAGTGSANHLHKCLNFSQA